MNLNLRTRLATVALAAVLGPVTAFAQHSHDGHSHNGATAARTSTAPRTPTITGPHGGSLRQTNGIQLETVVSQGGIMLFVYGRDGQPISVDQGRGAASVRVAGGAKRYRYDLLPDGKGGLTAPVNLSAIAGRQIDISIQLVGIASAGRQGVSFREVASVPASELQLSAAAIARQKICPVSGKPLGSMGAPVAVDVNGKKVFVCCRGCVDSVKSNPAKYASGRPEIVVTSATQADAALIARQKVCPVMDEPLGGMGTPVKVMVGNKPIYLCCKGCVKKVKSQPAKYLAMVYGESNSNPATVHTPAAATTSVRTAPARTAPAGGVAVGGVAVGSVPAGGEQVRAGVFKVTDADASFIAAQKLCPVMDEPLDGMGGPYKVAASGKAIYICCPGCAKSIAAEPQKYLAILAEQGVNAPLLR